MKLCVISLFSILGIAICKNPHGGMLIADIVEKLWQQADTDHDGHLSVTEFLAEFLTMYDHNHSGSVENHEFVQQWHHNYHDKHHVILHVFIHFDVDRDGLITSTDLTKLFHLLDYNVLPTCHDPPRNVTIMIRQNKKMF